MGPSDLAACRFAASPLYETLMAVRDLAGGWAPRADTTMARWLELKRPVFENLRRQVPMINVLAALENTPGFVPNFLAPPPGRAGDSAARQIEAVRATPQHIAHAEIAAFLAGCARPIRPALLAVLDRPDIITLMADALEAAWNELIRPDWALISKILEQDLHYRAQQLIVRGWHGVLADLDPERFCWSVCGDVPAIQMRTQRADELHPPGGGGVLFGPTLAADGSVLLESGWQREIRYPARGRANLVQQARPPASDPLARLIGQTRAHLLYELDQPATTTQLAYRHHLSLGAVGHHISALRAARLITGIRDRQSVIYSRTALGDALVNANIL